MHCTFSSLHLFRISLIPRLCCKKCGLWTSSLSLTSTLVRNVDSQVSPQTCWLRMYVDPWVICLPINTWEALTQASRASQGALAVKNPPADAGDIRDVGLIPGSGRSPGGGHGNPLQYSCLENPMDRGAWRAAVHGIAKSQTRLKRLSTYEHTHNTGQELLNSVEHRNACRS